MTAAIAVADWRIEGNIPLGFLYLFPMLLVGSVLNRWQIALSAAVCTVLTELFDDFAGSPFPAIPRDILIFAAFVCMGLFVYEVGRSRQPALLHLQDIEREAGARRCRRATQGAGREQPGGAYLRPIRTARILLANEAAHRLFGVAPGKLVGPLDPRLSALAAECSGARARTARLSAPRCSAAGSRMNGEVFLADVWFSTYQTSAGPRLAAMVVDASEDLRNREELSLNQLLAGSRILVGAVSHEIRNVCGAIAMAHANLARSGALAGEQGSSKRWAI